LKNLKLGGNLSEKDLESLKNRIKDRIKTDIEETDSQKLKEVT